MLAQQGNVNAPGHTRWGRWGLYLRTDETIDPLDRGVVATQIDEDFGYE